MNKTKYLLLALVFLGAIGSGAAQHKKKYRLAIQKVVPLSCINTGLLNVQLSNGQNSNFVNEIFEEARKPISVSMPGVAIINGKCALSTTGTSVSPLQECVTTLAQVPDDRGGGVTAFTVILYGTPEQISFSGGSGTGGAFCANDVVTLTSDACLTPLLNESLRWEVSTTGADDASFSYLKSSTTHTTTVRFSEIVGAELDKPIHFRVRYEKAGSTLGFSDIWSMTFSPNGPTFSGGQVSAANPLCVGQQGEIAITGTNGIPQVTSFNYRLQFKNNAGDWIPASTPNATQNGKNANNAPVVFSNLTPGEYRVEVTNGNLGNCAPGYSAVFKIEPAPDKITWSEPTCLLGNCLGNASGNFQTTCHGSTTSIAYTGIKGGVGNYKYRYFSPGTAEADRPAFTTMGGDGFDLALKAGTYIVEISDQNNCSQYDTWTIEDAPVITGSIKYLLKANGTSVTCPGANDGQIEVTPDGGVGPFQVVLKKGSDIKSTLENVTKGSTVTFSDLVANANDYTLEISETLSTTITNPCPQVIVVNPLTEPQAITAIIKKIQKANGRNLSCATTAIGATPDGALKITPQGGVGPFTIQVKNGSNVVSTAVNVARDAETTLGGLSAGVLYTIEVMDNSSCSNIATFSQTLSTPLNAPTAPYIGTTLTHVSCRGGNDGKIVVAPTGGENGTRFFMSAREEFGGKIIINKPTLDDGTITFDELEAGRYIVTVKDENGCTFEKLVELVAPSAIEANITLGTIPNGVAQVSCLGASDGQITVRIPVFSGSSSRAPYQIVLKETTTNATYTQTGININQNVDFTGLPGGTYTVTVTDKNNCAATFDKIGLDPITLTQPDPITATFSPAPVTCFNGTDGKVVINISGSNQYDPAHLTLKDINDGSKTFGDPAKTGPKQFEWSNLPAGNYQVIITDSKGCTFQGSNDQFDIVQPAQALALNVVANTPATCNGASDGKVTVAGAGGWGSYLYSNDGVNFTATPTANHLFDRLTAGSYRWYVKDILGCVAFVDATITEPDELVVNTNITHVKCNGDNNGKVTLQASGGHGPGSYTYSNQPNSGFTTNPTFNTLTQGTRTFYVRSNNACLTSVEVTINEPAVLVANVDAAKTQAITCHGLSDGSVTVDISGGTGPYRISADGGTAVSGNVVGGLSPGNHTLRIIDANDCFIEIASGVISEPAVLAVSLAAKKETACATAKGTARVSVTGGTGAYTYAWYDQGNQLISTTSSANNLSVGTYRVVVKDAKGCVAPDFNVTINQIALPDLRVISRTSASCAGIADGAATIELNGGVSPVSVVWENGQTGLTGTGLRVGINRVTLTDGDGCGVVREVNILEAPAMVIQATEQTNLACKGGATGKITVRVASGGVAPFTYHWDNGDTGNSIQNLSAGTYKVTIRDAKGCEQQRSFTLTEPALALTLNEVSKTPVACFGGSDGTAQVQGAGGNGTYLYSNDDRNTYQANNTFSGLIAGAHDIWVKDGLGCETKLQITIASPTELVPKVVRITHVDCHGGNNGSVTLGAAGGKNDSEGTYTYSTNPTSGFTSNATFPALSAGDYTYYVRTNNKCTQAIHFKITEPDVLIASIDASKTQMIRCKGANDGSVTLDISGGTAPYRISVDGSTAVAGNVVGGLSPGNHALRITDANDCFVEIASGIMSEPAAVQVSLIQRQNSGCTVANGSAEIKATGGTGAYTYQWVALANGASAGTGTTATNLGVGSYRVDVRDGNNCPASLIVNISALGAPEMRIVNTTPASCSTTGDGSATIEITSGAAPVTVSWDNGQTGFTATGLTSGDHQVTLTGSGGCQSIKTVNISLGPQMSIRATHKTNPQCFGDRNGSLTVSVTNGVAPYTYIWNNGDTGSSIRNLSAGVYEVTVQDAKGCEQKQSFALTAPTQLSVTIQSNTPPSCFDGTNGSIEVKASGGTAPYTYIWTHDPSETNALLSNVGAGVYEVTVKDANGCEEQKSIRVDNASEMMATVQKTLPSCGNAGDGQMIAQVTGGAGGYTYRWTSTDEPAKALSTTNTLSGVSAGSYALTITDQSNCTKTQTFTLDNPVQITLNTLTSTPPNCFGSSNGVLKVQAQGGATPYTYLWGDGQTGAEATGLAAGTHQVTVTDHNGCAKTFDLQLDNPAKLTIQLTNKTETACGLSKGSATVTVTGGTGTYLYHWYRISDNKSVSTGATANDLAQGNYRVSVEDANASGCSVSLEVTIGTVAAADMQVTNVVPVSCSTARDGAATIQITTGAAPVSVLWEDGQTGLTATGLTAKTHRVTLTDANGCRVEKTVTIPLAPAMTIQATSQVNPTCFGERNGKIAVLVSNGTAPYTYDWNTGATRNALNNVGAGNYRVTVQDANGCSQTADFQLTAPRSLAIAITKNQMPTCFNGCNGEITVEVSGGNAPYTYEWSHNAAQKNARITGVCAGVYTVKVTDANGCTISKNIRVEAPTDFIVTTQTESPGCSGAGNGKITANVSGGTMPYTYRWDAPGSPEISTAATLENVASGAYTFTVTDANGCSQTNTYVLDNPAPLVVSLVTAASSDPTCNGASNGVLEVQTQGGVAPYTYAWNTEQTGKRITGLAAGNYTVTVTDAKGCTVVAAYELFEPAPMALRLPETITLCPGQTYRVGLQDIGTQYTWTKNGVFFSNEREAILSEAGTYTLTAITFQGCTVTAKTEVLVSSDALDADFLLVDQGVVGDTISAIELSFPAPENIQWKVSGTDESRTLLSDPGFYEQQIIFHQAGIYTVTLYTASSTCQDSLTQIIEIFDTEQEAEGGRLQLEHQAENKVEEALVYPNPTNGTFKVHVKLGKPGTAKVSIRNSFHIEALDSQVKAGDLKYTFAFNLTNLTYGVYFAVIEAEGHTKILKIMIH